MKNTQIIAERIKLQSKEKGFSVKKLLESCELGVNTVTKMANGTDIVSQNLLKIAEYLDCSVDYLLGRTDEPNGIYSIIGDNNTQAINNGDNSQVTVTTGERVQIDKTIAELVELIQSLPLLKRAEAVLYLNSISQDIKKE